MMFRGHSRWLVAGGLGLLLQGCAAAVIPLAAGALMGDSLRNNDGNGIGSVEVTKTAAGLPDVASPQDVAAENAVANAGVTTARTTADAGSGESIELLDITELPAPTAAPGSGSRSASVIASFARYSLEQAAFYGTDADEARLSALLEQPGSLRPRRANCNGLPPAVVIDLDSGKSTVDPLADLPLPRELAPALTTLRDADIRIAWVSRIGADFADSLRMRLGGQGFDIGFSDILAMPADLDQRKQILRASLAERYCIVAILGDDRADFDELYLYLKSDNAAFALDSIIGQGWFLDPGFGASELSQAAAPAQITQTSDNPPGDQN